MTYFLRFICEQKIRRISDEIDIATISYKINFSAHYFISVPFIRLRCFHHRNPNRQFPYKVYLDLQELV